MADAQKLVPFILSWEGGYVNDPDDVGGATNKGITIATWRLHGCDNDGDGDIDADDLRIITNEQWMEIFKCQYWDRWKADEIENQSIANIVVDWVWASGVHGIKQVQKSSASRSMASSAAKHSPHLTAAPQTRCSIRYKRHASRSSKISSDESHPNGNSCGDGRIAF